MRVSVRPALTIGMIACGSALFWGCDRIKTPTQPNVEAANGSAPRVADDDFLLTDVSHELGIDFIHTPGPASFFFPEIVGSGVALLDYDQDGRLDIFFRTGTGAAP